MVMNSLLSFANTGFVMNGLGLQNQTEKADSSKSFKDILDSKTEKPERNTFDRQLASEMQKTGNKNDKQSDASVNRKTFRELEKETKTQNVKTEPHDKKAVSLQEKESDDSKADVKISDGEQKADIVLNCLAQTLGMKPEELSKLLDSAGIKPEDLGGGTTPEMISSKLSAVLGLNDGMEKTLTEVIKLISSQVESAISEVQKNPTESKIVTVKKEDVIQKSDSKAAIEVVGKSDAGILPIESSGLEALETQFKAKLQELGNTLDESQAGFAQKVSLQIQPVLQKIKQPETQQIKADSSEEIIPAAAEETDKSLLEKPVENDTKGEAGLEKHKDSKSQDLTNVQQNNNVQEIKEPSQQPAVSTVNQIQANSLKAEDSQVKVPIQAKEIINQVVEKAKVVLTGDKSEMIMDLKPESLGKISLKVVTEQGIVMAKFVAENQQVKQVLESNMQLLKDSLEKQGMDVQGFSVSVRQESHNANSGYEGRESNRRTFVASKPVGSRLYGEISDSGFLQRNNPYLQETGTINIRA